MKSVFLILFVLFVGVEALNAQEFTVTTGYGQIIFRDGSQVSGNIRYSLGKSTEVVYINELGKEMVFHVSKVNYFTIGHDKYLSVKIKGELGALNPPFEFGLLLNEPEARIKLYRTDNQNGVFVGGEMITDSFFYAGLPDTEENTVYAFSSMNINSAKKLIAYYKDCESIVEKLNKKEKGYTYSLFSGDKERMDVVNKLNEEYANCK